MPALSRKILFLLLIAALTMVVAISPEVISEGFNGFLQEQFPGYKWWHVAVIFVVASVLLVFLTSNFRKAGAKGKLAEKFNIPVSSASRELLQKAKTAVQNAEPEQALQHLGELKLPVLEADLSALNARLSAHERTKLQGIQSAEAESRSFNRINQVIIARIAALEKELAAGTENYQIIKAWLKKRYEHRLGQKLAGRQPVNLRRLPSTEGNSEETIAAFVSYGSEEIQATMAQTFRDAHGRLLVVGAPGAGKTTLLLQLVLDLLQSEPDALPVLLNLATWKKDYVTLEAWLAEILPAELGVSKRYAAEIIRQDRLILLFDGLDEVLENERNSCLDAIGKYGAEGGRRYVISSRKKEYNEAKDARVWWQIEVGSLTSQQLETQLEQVNRLEFPEAPDLLYALRKDTLLYRVAETPFYFNTLQLLFAGGKRLSDLKFSANTKEGREREIIERFVKYELDARVGYVYSTEQARHWLAFFASRLNMKNMVVFELRDLQYDWWRQWSKKQLILAHMVVSLVVGLFGCLLTGLSIGLCVGLFEGFNQGVNFGLIVGITKGVNMGLVIGLRIGGIAFLIVFLLKWISSHTLLIIIKDKTQFTWKFVLRSIIEIFVPSVFIGLVGGLVIGLFSLLISLLFSNDISQGLNNSMNNALELWLVIVVGIGPVLWIGYMIFLNQSEHDTNIIKVISPYQRFTTSMKSLHFSILQHLLLRYQMYRAGLLPLRLVDFLNEMSARHLLETDGASWRFRHRILQDYFAGQWVEEGNL